MVIGSREKGRLLQCLPALLAFSLMTLQVLAVLGALEQPAYAYVDPGSGLLALQILSTTFAGFIFIVRKRVHRFLMGMIRSVKTEDEVRAHK
jgi:hypothetical protein